MSLNWKPSDTPVSAQPTCILQLLTNSIHHCHPVVQGQNNVENPGFVFCRLVAFLGVCGASAWRHREYTFLGMLFSILSVVEWKPASFAGQFYDDFAVSVSWTVRFLGEEVIDSKNLQEMETGRNVKKEKTMRQAVNCIALCHCGNTYQFRDVLLFRCPRDKKVVELWSKQVRKTRADWRKHSKSCVLCRDHFEADCFALGPQFSAAFSLPVNQSKSRTEAWCSPNSVCKATTRPSVKAANTENLTPPPHLS